MRREGGHWVPIQRLACLNTVVNVLSQFKQTSRTKFVNHRRELATIQSYYYSLFWMFVHSYSKRAKEVAELLFQLNFEDSERNKN